jgi:glycerophosphoryl diester phosphodiesterase
VQCWFSTLPRSHSGAGQIAAAGGDGWFCPLNRASPQAIWRARSKGIGFGVWTVNRARDMQRLIEAKVDGICTDRPDRLRQMLAHHAGSG